MLVHEGGDTTSLYFYLPRALKRLFLLSGYAVVSITVLSVFFQRKRGVMAPLSVAFIAYLLFTGFNWMTHINYVVSVLALGTAGLGARLVSLPEP
jgi:hypothetical protein